MSHIFITYGDAGYEAAKARLVEQARSTGEFDFIYSFGREDLSEELLASDIINVKRGGGLWSWKPDVIYKVMLMHEKGDKIVYCDAGCSVYESKEWKKIWNVLDRHDMIAQLIFQQNYKWTRKELADHFSGNMNGWLTLCQFQADPIIIISDFTLQFVKEWRDMMIHHPEFAMDVTEEERSLQVPGFIESRHDQAVYSALVYKYLTDPAMRSKIYPQWERVEDYDFFQKQAVRATRLRHGEAEPLSNRVRGGVKRLLKNLLFKPLHYNPLQGKSGIKING